MRRYKSKELRRRGRGIGVAIDRDIGKSVETPVRVSTYIRAVAFNGQLCTQPVLVGCRVYSQEQVRQLEVLNLAV